MDRKLILFWGGIMLVIALFIPLTLLQDSGKPAVAAKAKKARKSKWAFLEEPGEVTVRFTCLHKRKKSQGEMHRCQVLCPSSMLARRIPKQRALHRCFRGRWTVVKQSKLRSVAKRSVSLVEQQSAPPELLNSLLNSYLNLSQNYLATAYFFDRADVQLPGFHHYFMGLWRSSVDQATSIMAYINKRGGWIDMQNVPRPALTDTLIMAQREGRVGLVAMETAVGMEVESQRLILQVTEVVEKPKHNDPHMLHTLQEKYLSYKVKLSKELMDYVSQLRAFEQAGEEDYRLGEYEMDGLLQ